MLYKDIIYVGQDLSTREKLYGMRCPITKEHIIFRVTAEDFIHQRIPLEALELADYIKSMKYALEQARDFAGECEALTSLCDDEINMFGVRKKWSAFQDIYNGIMVSGLRYAIDDLADPYGAGLFNSP